MSNNKYNVPVLMYHSIGVPNKAWNWNYLTCPYDRFESQLKAIEELGLNTISLNTLYEYMVNGKTIPKKSIALTFDDGYADIWIYAYPLLKKYKMCGTVFINPDFVDPRENKNDLYELNGKSDHLSSSGFLSWSEIIQMDKEKVIFSESHALTHTWYPITDEIIDFRNPTDSYTWMTWNNNPELKYNLQIDANKLKQLGQPVYKHEKSLMHKRYFPDNSLDNYLKGFVKEKGGIEFFKQNNYKAVLFEQVEEYKKQNELDDKYESQEEYEKRIRYELEHTKTLLEEKLKRKITFLCWPGGSATKIGMKIATDLGYLFFNSARDLTLVERNEIRNVSKGGNRIKRFTPLIYFNGQENYKSKIIYANKFWMKLYVFRNNSSLLSKVVFKIASICSNILHKG